jgi:hypothetical protein
LPHLPAPLATIAIAVRRTVVICGVRPRLQRRDRNGFTPFSLFFTPDAKSKVTPTSPAILTPWDGLSTYELDGVLGEFFNRLEI